MAMLTSPADGYAPANFADDIEAFMDAVGLQSSVLLGSLKRWLRRATGRYPDYRGRYAGRGMGVPDQPVRYLCE